MPPVADKVGDTRHDHEPQREERVADDGAQGELGGVAPLTACVQTHCDRCWSRPFKAKHCRDNLIIALTLRDERLPVEPIDLIDQVSGSSITRPVMSQDKIVLFGFFTGLINSQLLG